MNFNTKGLVVARKLAARKKKFFEIAMMLPKLLWSAWCGSSKWQPPFQKFHACKYLSHLQP